MDREYKGDPVDMTYSHLSERPALDVEVPQDNSHDGSVKTVQGDGTELQETIRRVRFTKPDLSYGDISHMLNCSKSYVYEVLNESTGGKYERFRKETWEEFTNKQKAIITLRIESDMTRSEISRAVDVSAAMVTKVLEANSWIIDGGDEQ